MWGIVRPVFAPHHPVIVFKLAHFFSFTFLQQKQKQKYVLSLNTKFHILFGWNNRIAVKEIDQSNERNKEKLTFVQTNAEIIAEVLFFRRRCGCILVAVAVVLKVPFLVAIDMLFPKLGDFGKYYLPTDLYRITCAKKLIELTKFEMLHR